MLLIDERTPELANPLRPEPGKTAGPVECTKDGPDSLAPADQGVGRKV
jgi:hypothetical protein